MQRGARFQGARGGWEGDARGFQKNIRFLHRAAQRLRRRRSFRHAIDIQLQFQRVCSQFERSTGKRLLPDAGAALPGRKNCLLIGRGTRTDGIRQRTIEQNTPGANVQRRIRPVLHGILEGKGIFREQRFGNSKRHRPFVFRVYRLQQRFQCREQFLVSRISTLPEGKQAELPGGDRGRAQQYDVQRKAKQGFSHAPRAAPA